MTKTPETPTAPKKPDGIITTQINNQTIVAELFFNHGSKETFQDKLLRVILAENPIHSIPKPPESEKPSGGVAILNI